MQSLKTTAQRGVRAFAEKLDGARKPTHDAAAMGVQMARHGLDQAEGAAVVLGRFAQRHSGEIARLAATRAKRSPILVGALLVAAVTGGVLLASARARTALRTGAKDLGNGIRDAGYRGAKSLRRELSTARTSDSRAPERARSRQEALLDEGIEETFPASDPVSVKRIT